MHSSIDHSQNNEKPPSEEEQAASGSVRVDGTQTLAVPPGTDDLVYNEVDGMGTGMAIPASHDEKQEAKTASNWQKWLESFKRVLPVYVVTHLVFLVLTYLAILFRFGNFSTTTFRFSTLLDSWNRWDTGHFIFIATNGYDTPLRSAFFPLFPLLERGLAFLTHDPFIAGLIISNLAGLGMLVVLHQLVQDDFDAERAYRTVLYLAIFPTAFFFAAAYNETLFLFLTLLSFYNMRRGNFWLAGLFGFVASLTRSAGIVLLLPFFYEYLRPRVGNFERHPWNHLYANMRKIRFDIISGLGIPAGIGCYALYCYLRFHDPLSFSHAQLRWDRHLEGPWQGLIDAIVVMQHRRILSFDSIHTMLDLSMCIFVLGLVVLGFVGSGKFARENRAYALYAALIYLFSLIYPTGHSVPLAAFSRYMLEVFPAFIVLAAISKKEIWNLYYVMLSLSVQSFMLLQFLTGHWII